MTPLNVVERPSERPIAYIKDACPFSMRFVVFLAEAGLLNDFQVVLYSPEAPGFEAIRAHLEAGTGKAPSFPTVESPDGRFESESSALIDHYCAAHGLDRAKLLALELFERGVMAANGRMYLELRALREAKA